MAKRRSPDKRDSSSKAETKEAPATKRRSPRNHVNSSNDTSAGATVKSVTTRTTASASTASSAHHDSADVSPEEKKLKDSGISEGLDDHVKLSNLCESVKGSAGLQNDSTSADGRSDSDSEPVVVVAEQQRFVPEHVRTRQRAVAQREAARLARPEKRSGRTLGHADRKKSAVSSTPFGILASSAKKSSGERYIDGLNTSEWCGPFSLARQMIAKREEAKRQRELEDQEESNQGRHPLDELMVQVELEQKRKSHPSLQWKGTHAQQLEQGKKQTNQNLYSKRQKRVDMHVRSKVPNLFDLCVKYLVDNFEHVECLGTSIDNAIRTSIAKELVANNKLNGQSFPALAEEGIDVLEIVDCADISQHDLCDRLKVLLPAGLQYLVLDQAGRCVGPKAVHTIIDCLQKYDDSCSLQALSVGGAYLLKDEDAAQLIAAAAKAGLSSIEFKACPLLGPLMLNSIRTSFSSSALLKCNTGLLELALEDLTTLTTSDLQALVSDPSSLRCVKSLSLRRIGGLDDDIVAKLLEITTSSLEGLDLSDNNELTDLTLEAVRKYSSHHLRALRLNGLKSLTAAGLEATFMFVQDDENFSSPPPMLRFVDLGNLDHEAVTDDVVHQVALAATTAGSLSIDNDGENCSSLHTIGRPSSGGLVNFNIQGSSLVTDSSMETLAATCNGTLEELNVSFCHSITNQGLGYLVDKCGKQLRQVQIWGNAQISDVFLDGNRRVDDPDLEIVGAWMKNSASRTIR